MHAVDGSNATLDLAALVGELRQLLAHLPQQNSNSARFFTTEQIAQLSGRSAYTVRRWISQGRLRATRVTGTGPRGRLLIPATELEKLIGNMGDSTASPRTN
jgi:excisionase family DNA binding protein